MGSDVCNNDSSPCTKNTTTTTATTESLDISIVSDNALRPSDDLLDYLRMELNPDSERTILASQHSTATADSSLLFCDDEEELSIGGDCETDGYGYDSFYYDSVTTLGVIPSPMTTPTGLKPVRSPDEGTAVVPSCCSSRWNEISSTFEGNATDHQPVPIRPLPARSPLFAGSELRKKQMVRQSNTNDFVLTTPTTSNTSSKRALGTKAFTSSGNSCGSSINKHHHNLVKRSPPWNKWSHVVLPSDIRKCPHVTHSTISNKDSSSQSGHCSEIIVDRHTEDDEVGRKQTHTTQSKDELYSILERSLSIANNSTTKTSNAS